MKKFLYNQLQLELFELCHYQGWGQEFEELKILQIFQFKRLRSIKCIGSPLRQLRLQRFQFSGPVLLDSQGWPANPFSHRLVSGSSQLCGRPYDLIEKMGEGTFKKIWVRDPGIEDVPILIFFTAACQSLGAFFKRCGQHFLHTGPEKQKSYDVC